MTRLSKLIFLLVLLPVLYFARGDYYKGASAGASAGCVYDMCETFEASEFDNGACGSAPCVTESGAIDGDTATSGLDAGIDMEPDKCVTIGYNGAYLDLTFGNTAEWVYFKGHFAFNDAMEETRIILHARSAASDHGYIYITSAGAIAGNVSDGSSSSSGDAAIAVDTDVWIKVKAKIGTGANAEFWCSYWTGAAWSSWYGDNDGTRTANIIEFRLLNTQDAEAEDQFWDSVEIEITDTDPFDGDPTS